ncbi:hypothetical protein CAUPRSCDRAFT_12603, partial [Caulochytrium protostelioides]
MDPTPPIYQLSQAAIQKIASAMFPDRPPLTPAQLAEVIDVDLQLAEAGVSEEGCLSQTDMSRLSDFVEGPQFAAAAAEAAKMQAPVPPGMPLAAQQLLPIINPQMISALAASRRRRWRDPRPSIGIGNGIGIGIGIGIVVAIAIGFRDGGRLGLRVVYQRDDRRFEGCCRSVRGVQRPATALHRDLVVADPVDTNTSHDGTSTGRDGHGRALGADLAYGHVWARPRCNSNPEQPAAPRHTGTTAQSRGQPGRHQVYDSVVAREQRVPRDDRRRVAVIVAIACGSITCGRARAVGHDVAGCAIARCDGVAAGV